MPAVAGRKKQPRGGRYAEVTCDVDAQNDRRHEIASADTANPVHVRCHGCETHCHWVDDGGLVHAIEFRIVDLIAVDHGRAGRRQAAAMSPAARGPLPHRRCRRLDQLQHAWSVGPGEPNADRIEDEDARRANSRLGQVFKPRPAYVLGEDTYCIAHRFAPPHRLRYGFFSAQCRAISSRVAAHTSSWRSTWSRNFSK